ncbi:MAG TPA: response regulator [Candidatus Angelobacter sp.]|jgi:DNA-binding NtrC family response regulator
MARKPSLLIVDDENNVALTLKMVFEREGYAVLTANSCAGALKLLADGHVFDAVITDLNMEKENIGLEVARAALRLHPKPAVVVCTGYASIDNSAAALQMKVDYLATKPVDLDELKRAVSRLMAFRNEKQ